jgi:hypothetical protein
MKSIIGIFSQGKAQLPETIETCDVKQNKNYD